MAYLVSLYRYQAGQVPWPSLSWGEGIVHIHVQMYMELLLPSDSLFPRDGTWLQDSAGWDGFWELHVVFACLAVWVKGLGTQGNGNRNETTCW